MFSKFTTRNIVLESLSSVRKLCIGFVADKSTQTSGTDEKYEFAGEEYVYDIYWAVYFCVEWESVV